jgi:hypothetical protein
MSTQFRRMKANAEANTAQQDLGEVAQEKAQGEATCLDRLLEREEERKAKRPGYLLDEVLAEIEQETGGEVFEPIPQRRVDDFPGMPTQMGTPPAPPARVSQVLTVGVSRGLDPSLMEAVAQRVDPQARMGRTEAAIIVDGVAAAHAVGVEAIQILAMGGAEIVGLEAGEGKAIGGRLALALDAKRSSRDPDHDPDGGASCPPSPIAAFPPLPDEPPRPLPPSETLDALDLADVVAAQGWGVNFYEELEMRLGDERAEVFGQIALTLGLVGLDDEPEHAAQMVERGYRFLARAKRAIKRVSSLLNDAA